MPIRIGAIIGIGCIFKRVMRSLFRYIANFIQREWFLLLTAAVISLIIYIFES